MKMTTFSTSFYYFVTATGRQWRIIMRLLLRGTYRENKYQKHNMFLYMLLLLSVLESKVFYHQNILKVVFNKISSFISVKEISLIRGEIPSNNFLSLFSQRNICSRKIYRVN